MQRNLYSTEFIEQALIKARARVRRTLQSIAIELNISLGTLKGWLKRSSYALRPGLNLLDCCPAASRFERKPCA